MDIDPTAPPRRKLPVLAVVRRSYTYAWDYRDLLAMPVMVLIGVQIVLALILYFLIETPRGGAAAPALTFLCSVLAYLVTMAFAVGMHRTILLGETKPGLSFFRFDGFWGTYFLNVILFFLAYIGTFLALMAVMGIVFLIVGLIGSGPGATIVGIVGVLGGLLGYFWLLGMMARLSLSFPAAALGQTKRFTLAWRATRGNTWRLIGAWILVILPMLVVMLLVYIPTFGAMMAEMRASIDAAARAGTPPDPDAIYHIGLLARVVPAIMGALTAPVLVAVLSLSYDVLVRGGGPQDGGAKAS